MNVHQLLEHASGLRDQGKFREAHEAFLEASKNTDNIVEKAGILLNDSTTLTSSGEFGASRQQLHSVRELISIAKEGTLSLSDQYEVLALLVFVEIEQAEILAAEGQPLQALGTMAAALKRYESELRVSPRLDIYDELQARRAYLLADMGSFEKALPILTELVDRQSQNPTFLFYLGQCYLVGEQFENARDLFARAIKLGPSTEIEFQAHCSLGMAYYELEDYATAKFELEFGVKTATAGYIKQAQIWKWLEYSCRGLGLVDEANRYAMLSQST
jgi:tetratricopeptide (TPR) repeat protein